MNKQLALLFQQVVRHVEIEISSACNRSCPYCPQGFLRRGQQLMPPELFEKIVRELQEFAYTGTVAFHQYNEPLLVPEHLRATLALTARYLPQSITILYTNGDFLTPELAGELGKSGLRHITTNCHLTASETWSPELALSKVYKLCKKLGIPASAINSDNFSVLSQVAGVSINITCHDFMRQGSNRLGTVPVTGGRKRRDVCSQMLKHLNVAYTGMGYMCCECCHGLQEAEPYALGPVAEKGLLGLFKAKLPFIEGYASGDLPQACKGCIGF